MTYVNNPSVAPPADEYDPEANPFGHGQYLRANPTGAFEFTDVIDFFDGVPGPAQWLSNFHPSPMSMPTEVVVPLLWPDLAGSLSDAHRECLDGLIYATGECAFQAFKAKTFDAFHRIAVCDEPGEAKALGQTTPIRHDWRGVRVEVMRAVLAAKFEVGSEAANQLLATGTAMLCEGNEWGDAVWGLCRQPDGSYGGHNLLGVVLLERRGVLREIDREATNV